MATGDMSGCLEVSSGYGNMLRFDSGKFGISFDSTGGVDERIWGKDPTAVYGAMALYIEQIYLTGCASGGNVALCDGSGGEAIVTLANSDVSYGGGVSQEWDFGNDALVCMTADNTQSLCVSSTIDGFVSGFVKCWWGPAPK
jgi:hypothetical protein